MNIIIIIIIIILILIIKFTLGHTDQYTGGGKALSGPGHYMSIGNNKKQQISKTITPLII